VGKAMEGMERDGIIVVAALPGYIYIYIQM